MEDLRENAREFCARTGTTVKFEFTGKMPAPWDEARNWHNAYKVTFKRDGRRFSIRFFDSLNATEKGETPTEYDVLACIMKSDPGDFEEFLDEFGYTINSVADYKKHQATWRACRREWHNVERLFGDVLNELQEIY